MRNGKDVTFRYTDIIHLRKDFSGRPVKYDSTVFHHDQPGGHAGDIFHAVRDHDYGNSACSVQRLDFAKDICRTLRIQTRCRLIQDQDCGAHGQDACNGDPAFLSTGEFERGVILEGVVVQAHHAQSFFHSRLHLLLTQPCVAGAEGHILVHRFPEQLVLRILEHHTYFLTNSP